jgi:glycosyltransferase involved in cell wall biosynthesis
MRVGIDAKWYFTGPVSTRVVLHNLLPQLFAHYPDVEWVIFLDKKDRHLPFPFEGKNIHTRYIWADNNMLSNVLLLPFHCRRQGVEIMVFQTFPSILSRVPSVAFIHDVLFRDYPQFFSRKERIYFLPLAFMTRYGATRLVATTEFVAADLVRYRYTRSRSNIDLVPLGVAPGYQPAEAQDARVLAQVRAKFQLPDRYLLYVGRLNVRKNIEALLRAIPLMRDENISLVIVGKEDSRAPDLKALLSRPEVGSRIILTGGMTDEELRAAYSMATVFCFPSFAEGFGLPPLEAMASGVPVLVANTTSLPEVCGEAATYIDPANPASIATALDELLSDETLYKRKRSAGLERARGYTWARTGQTLMQSITNAFKKPIL